MSQNVTKNLTTEVKEYLRLRKELAKTEIIIKSTETISALIITLISIIFFSLTITFIVIATILYIKQYTGDIAAYLIGSLLFILIWIVIYLLRKRIINNQIAKFIKQIISI